MFALLWEPVVADYMMAVIASKYTFYFLWAVIAMGLGVFLLDLAGLVPEARLRLRRTAASTPTTSPKMLGGAIGWMAAPKRIFSSGGKPRWGGISILVAAIVMVWHFALVTRINLRVRSAYRDREMADTIKSASVNPITNLVTIKMFSTPRDPGASSFEAAGGVLEDALVQLAIPKFIEGPLNVAARSHYDFYAMVIPYKVQVTMVSPDKR